MIPKITPIDIPHPTGAPARKPAETNAPQMQEQRSRPKRRLGRKQQQLSTFQAELRMISLLLNMLTSSSNLSVNQLQNQNAILKHVQTALAQEEKKQLQAIKAQNAQIERSRHESFWGQLGHILLAVVCVAAVSIFVGPVAGAAIGITSILSMVPIGNRSVMGTMFHDMHINNTLLKGVVEVGVCAAFSLGASALATGADLALANAADMAANDGAKTISTEAFSSAFCTTGALTASTIFVQTLLTSGAVLNLVAGISGKSKNSLGTMIAATILTIIISLIAMRAGGNMAGSSSTLDLLLSRIGTASKTSKLFAALQSGIRILQNTGALSRLMGVFLILSGSMNVAQGFTQLALSKNLITQGEISEAINLLQALQNWSQSNMTMNAESSQEDMNNLQNSFNFQALTQQGKYIAELYA